MSGLRPTVQLLEFLDERYLPAATAATATPFGFGCGDGGNDMVRRCDSRQDRLRYSLAFVGRDRSKLSIDGRFWLAENLERTLIWSLAKSNGLTSPSLTM